MLQSLFVKKIVFVFLFFACFVYSQKLQFPKIESFENFARTIPEGEEIEMCMIDIPGDYLLCNQFDYSTGSIYLCIYRFKSSKKIFLITEDGASSCNGDAEFMELYLYDQDGHVVYFESGGFFPSKKFYENGIAILEIVFPGEFSTGSVTKIQKPDYESMERERGIGIQGADEFQLKLDSFYANLQKRVAQLENLKGLEKEAKEEADTNIHAIHKALKTRGEYSFKNFVIRKPRPGKDQDWEEAYLNAVDIRVRSQPSSSSQVIGKVSYYDRYITVLDIKGNETIEGYGTHPWYKINFIDSKGKEITGWIFGAFIMNSVYEK